LIPLPDDSIVVVLGDTTIAGEARRTTATAMRALRSACENCTSANGSAAVFGGIWRDSADADAGTPRAAGIRRRLRAMEQTGQDLKTYLDGKFAGIDGKFAGIDARLARLEDGQAELARGQTAVAGRLDRVDDRLAAIDTHLDAHDKDLEVRTLHILETIQESANDSKRWAARLFAVLDRQDATRKGY
jgi:hypothetical protein